MFFPVWGNTPMAESCLLGKSSPVKNYLQQVPDTVRIDTVGVLPYPFSDQQDFSVNKDSSKLYLQQPPNIKTVTEYDSSTGGYTIYKKIGNMNYRLPQSVSMNDYLKFDVEQSIKNYWREKQRIQYMDEKGFNPSLTIGGKAFNRIFGGNSVNIKAQGYVEVNFGYMVTTNDNPSLTESMRRVSSFDFDQSIQMNVNGSIGESMKMQVNYNTEATFDFENQMNIDYKGDEDNIIKSIEAGNVSLPLEGSLITGTSNLFGVKADLQFGRLTATTLFSQSKGETTTIELEGGAEKRSFEIDAADYDENRHFFLSQYFRDHYDEALKNLPVINSSITINKIEVWVTNKSGDYTDSRNIVAFMDLGEHDDHIYNTVPDFQETSGLTYPESGYPFNGANGQYNEIINNYSEIRTVSKVKKALSPLSSSYAFEGGQDYEKVEQARLLSSSEYTINEELGYISLTSALSSDEVLAVAYNYTAKGETYQVGEFSTDGVSDPECLVVKLIKGTNLSPGYPTWDLMMKNVYNLSAYDIKEDDFTLNVLYLSRNNYINYFPTGAIAGHKFLTLMNLDNLNSNQDNTPDGVFDYVEDVTIYPSTGRIIFPVVEPFGNSLADSINNESIAEKYTFQSLYDSTQTYAEEDSEHAKFILRGTYKGSSSNEISVGSINLSQGSVTVSANGVELTENLDYTVNYSLGTIKIINQSLIDSGASITITTESEELNSVQQKTLIGTHLNYAFSDNFNVGATVFHMEETPLTSKVSYGEDAISNTMLGLNANYAANSEFITKMVDKLPFVDTNSPSSIEVEGEFAKLIPGNNSDETSYIDDFESTKTSINMRSAIKWHIASTPQNQNDLFPEGDSYDDKSYGYNRAKLAWYTIEPTMVRGGSSAPSNLRGSSAYEELSNHYIREVYEEEIFPDRESEAGESTRISVFDLAYYPEEKGPYNYDTKPSTYSAGVNEDGTLSSPESRWGGIMRDITNSNFESANIAYIEFWVMDPFIYDTLGTDEGGDLYFNLGEISEDILKDGLKAYENGLPETEVIDNVDSTIWGLISTEQSVGYEFSGGDNARANQDIGFDGLNNESEKGFFTSYLESLSDVVNSTALEEAKEDPSSDDFHHYKGSDYDEEELSVLARYKKYNGQEGNSTPGTESYTTIATSSPDIEDINEDNTMNEYERYYQYKISIRPDSMVLGKNNIVDIKKGETVKLKNGTTDNVNWYQFRIPIKEPDETIGSISNFKSIRFMRMFLKEFKEPVVLRFATLDLVRSSWRKYTGTIQDEDNENISSADAEIEVSAVSLEENGSRDPINYILPPGAERTIDPSSTQLIQEDEQSLELTVTDLEAGDSRAAYKSFSVDVRNYERLIMDVHAEAIEDDDNTLDDNELCLFLRLGSDYNNNYYEYEVPLIITPAGDYSSSSTTDRYTVWPDENRINVKLSAFTDLKKERNAAIKANSGLSTSDIYKGAYDDWMDGRDTIRIKGNPSLSNVEVMMIGVRHKKKSHDLGPKSIEVWANELRLYGYNEEGGWAANLRTTLNLADLGTVNLAYSRSTAGFGSIDSKVNERSTDDYSLVNISTNMNLGKFFPEKLGIQLPMYFNYSKSVINPKYNPFDDDLTMKESLKALDTKEEKDSLKNMAQEVSEQKTISFSNIKINKTLKKDKTTIIDPANFSASFTYNESKYHDPETEYEIERNYKGVLYYNYNAKAKTIQPFKKSKIFSKGVLRLIRDFNFNLYPTQISTWICIDRDYNETLLRDISTDTDLLIDPTYDKEFTLERYFSMVYNLTRSLRLNFTTQSTAIIDEPEGRINRKDDDYTEKRDSIIKNLLSLGRPIDYTHTVTGNYTLPINKIKLLDWTSVNANYRGTYTWTGGSVTDESIELGNEIQNTRVFQLNGQMNMTRLYNKVDFLKDINKEFGRSRRRKNSRQQQQKKSDEEIKTSDKEEIPTKNVRYSAKNIKLKANTTKKILHKLKTKDVQVKVINKKGKRVTTLTEVVNRNVISIKSSENIENAKVIVTGKVKETQEDTPLLKIAKVGARVLMGVRSLSFNYSSNDGTYLPGYLPEPKTFGFGGGKYTPDKDVFGSNMRTTMAPGVPFLLGWQDDDFALKAIKNGWITKDTSLNSPYIMKQTETYNLRGVIEPLPNLKITLTAIRTHTQRSDEYFYYDPTTDGFSSSNPTCSGNFSMTINTLGTAFEKMRGDGVPDSKAYSNFRRYRQIIAKRLANEREINSLTDYDSETLDEEGNYPDGYSSTSQQVLIPSFLAAYTGRSAGSTSLSPFPSLKYLRPNWKITYDGLLSKVEGLNRIFKEISLSHQYKSSYSVGSYSSNLYYDDTEYEDGLSYVRNTADNFIGMYDFSSVNITEQLNPLLNIEVEWVNELETQVEVSRSRNITLSLTNNRITEILQNEISFGLGYRFTHMDLIIKTKRSQKIYSNDLNIHADLAFSRNKTILRQIDENDNELSAGQNAVTLKTTADYMLSDKFQMSLYFDKTLNHPMVGSYDTGTTSFGVSFKFTLAQ